MVKRKEIGGGREGPKTTAVTTKISKKHPSHLNPNKKKIALAGAKLAGRMLNPKNTGKMIKDAVRGKGLVLPGSNYIGPGNPMGRKVMSKGDALAKKHDETYNRMLKAGFGKKRVYGGYSYSDKKLMDRSDLHTPEGLVTYGGMKAKQLAHKAGLKHITGKKLTKKELLQKEQEQKKKKMMMKK